MVVVGCALGVASLTGWRPAGEQWPLCGALICLTVAAIVGGPANLDGAAGDAGFARLAVEVGYAAAAVLTAFAAAGHHRPRPLPHVRTVFVSLAVPVVFALHNFAYEGNRIFRPTDAILVLLFLVQPRRLQRRHLACPFGPGVG